MNEAAPNVLCRPMPRWHLLFFVLAGFDLLTIVATLFLSHRLMQDFERSVSVNHVWADRLANYNELASLASAVNAPGNEVFETLDVESASADLEVQFAAYLGALAKARTDLESNVEASRAAPLLALLAEAEMAVRDMAGESRAIFVHFREEEREAAGARMASMDRELYRAVGALASLQKTVQAHQRDLFASQAATADRMRRYEYGIACLVVLMVFGVTTYGHSISKKVKASHEELVDVALRLDEASKAAAAASQAKSAFLANMSHEIRTPMTAILGFTDIFLEEDNSLSTKLDAAQAIQRNGEHLLALINDILDLSKIEAGKLEVERVEVEVATVLGDVVDLLRDSAAGKGNELRVVYDTPIPETVQTDGVRLKQALVNLVGNGIKFTNGGEVVVRVSCDELQQQLLFRVIDTGIGLTPDAIEKLFQPFTQADVSTTREFGGTGLGLTITRRVAELLGGDVTAHQAKTGGAEFRFSISTGPMKDARYLERFVHQTVWSDENPGNAQTSNARVLLVDDGADNLRLLETFLVAAGATVTTRENGQEGMDEALRAHRSGEPYDVVLMDMQMPVMDGVTATRELRRKGYQGPILALTAEQSEQDRRRCLHAGCNAYLSKPLSRDDLIQAVEDAARSARRTSAPSV